MIQALIFVLTSVASWLIPRLLAASGTVAISVTVLNPIFNYLQDQVMTRLNGLSADAVHFLQFTGIPEAISIIFSAYAMAIGMKAATVAFSRSGSKGNV